MVDESRLKWALALSLLLHALLLTLLPIMRHAQLALPQPPALLDVDVLPMPQPKPAPPPRVAAAPPPAQPAPEIPQPKNQIVSQPDAGEEKVPKDAHLLSDRNNVVKEETIKRGEPLPGDPDAHPKPPEQVAKLDKPRPLPRPAVEDTQPKPKPAALPKLDQLLPTDGDLLRAGVAQAARAAAPPPDAEQEATTRREDLLRHGDPWHSTSLHPGSMDFLPSVREGDITMLNTKAEQFAPFVRRVAMRVFENFIITERRSAGNRLTESVQEYAVVEAIMDRQGTLLTINLKERSSTVMVGTDRNLQNACQEGCFDRNPPSGAEANDGTIHFLFVAQVQLAVDPRSGRPVGDARMSAGLL